jgi:hypothetical protein
LKPTILMALLMALPAGVPLVAAGPLEQVKVLVESQLEDPPLPHTDIGLLGEPQDLIERVVSVSQQAIICLREAATRYINGINHTLSGDPDRLAEELNAMADENANRTADFVREAIGCLPSGPYAICFKETADLAEALPTTNDPGDMIDRHFWASTAYDVKSHSGRPFYQLIGIKVNGNLGAECPDGWT